MGTTYSFSDHNIVLAPVGYPVYQISGQGLGSIGFDYESPNSMNSRAADGNVITSKIQADNGSLHLTVQQTSYLHTWLKGAFNFLNAADPSLWAASAITISTISGFELVLATGVSFEKRAPITYEAQVGMLTWTFLAQSIQIV